MIITLYKKTKNLPLWITFCQHLLKKDTIKSCPFWIFMDLGRIELPFEQCECSVLPLNYKPMPLAGIEPASMA